MKQFNIFVFFLLIFAGLNTGFLAFEFNIIEYLFGKIWIDKILYILIGLGSIYALANWKHFCPCKAKKK